ncbi:MAG: energy transducer TonB [Bacteroidales bacterium]|jgi:TonB family protein|nr:energy transducer TonB [Bacteroidales bacterium]
MVKKHIILIILLILANFVYSQIDSLEFDQRKCDIYGLRHWDNSPIFDKSAKNDFEKLFEFIQENLVYPATAKADKIEGQVFVEFWIDTTGVTSEHKIIKSVRQDLDDEVLRVARLIKFDVPAHCYNGKPIGICWQFPIRFRLDDPEFLFYRPSDKDESGRKKKSKDGGDSSKVIDNKKRNNGL